MTWEAAAEGEASRRAILMQTAGDRWRCKQRNAPDEPLPTDAIEPNERHALAEMFYYWRDYWSRRIKRCGDWRPLKPCFGNYPQSALEVAAAEQANRERNTIAMNSVVHAALNMNIK